MITSTKTALLYYFHQQKQCLQLPAVVQVVAFARSTVALSFRVGQNSTIRIYWYRNAQVVSYPLPISPYPKTILAILRVTHEAACCLVRLCTHWQPHQTQPLPKIRRPLPRLGLRLGTKEKESTLRGH